MQFHKTTVLLPTVLHEALRGHASRMGWSPNKVVTKAIDAKMAGDEERRAASWGPHRGGVAQGISVPPDVRELTAVRRGGLTGFVADALGAYLKVDEPVDQSIAGENPGGSLGQVSTFDVLSSDLEIVREAAGILKTSRTGMLRKIIGDWARAWRLEHGDKKVFGCATGCGKLVEVQGNFCQPCYDEVHGLGVAAQEDPAPAQTARLEPKKAKATPKGVTPVDYTGPRCGNCWAASTDKFCPKCVVEMAARVAARAGTAAAPPVTRPAVVMCAVCQVKPETGAMLCDDCAPADPSWSPR